MSWLKTAVLLALMLLSATLSVWATPTEYLSKMKQRKPLQSYIEPSLDNWQIDNANQVLVTSAVLDEKLQSAYADLLNEHYVNEENKRIMLSVAYSDNQRNGLAVHLPEACYPAQGFEILDVEYIPIRLNNGHKITVEYMNTQRGSRIEPLIYWTVSGEHIYQNNFERKRLSIEYALNNIIPDGLIFRVSTNDSNKEMALEIMTDFVRDFYSSIPEDQKSRFFGQENTH